MRLPSIIEPLKCPENTSKAAPVILMSAFAASEIANNESIVGIVDVSVYFVSFFLSMARSIIERTCFL